MSAALTAILICAAGAGSRMRGADKLLEPVAGRPLLAQLAAAAVATGAPVLVALPPGAAGVERAKALPDHAVIALTVADAAQGMSGSIRAGVAAAGDAPGLVVMLGDMPEIDTPALARLLAAHAAAPDRVIRAASASDQPGHPVLFPRRLFPALALLTGDTGARDILRCETAELVPLPGQAALTDLDTPEAWAAWRARQP
jgi:CTP:molybdopterin cytidylyltransferase MocA